jgi:Uma2 family endonuclease
MGILERLVADGVTRRKFTGEEVLAMCEAGILGDPCHVEVIEGEMLEMAPEGDEHNYLRLQLTEELNSLQFAGLGKQSLYQIAATPTIWLPDGGIIEPDVCILQRTRKQMRIFSSDILIGIEISKSSLAYDLGAKRALYAQLKIPEYWVVNVKTKEVLVHTSPVENEYSVFEKFHAGDVVRSATLPDIVLPVESFL